VTVKDFLIHIKCCLICSCGYCTYLSAFIHHTQFVCMCVYVRVRACKMGHSAQNQHSRQHSLPDLCENCRVTIDVIIHANFVHFSYKF